MSGLIPHFGIAQGRISSSVLVQVCYLGSTLAQVIIIVSSRLCKWEDFIFGHLNLNLQEWKNSGNDINWIPKSLFGEI